MDGISNCWIARLTQWVEYQFIGKQDQLNGWNIKSLDSKINSVDGISNHLIAKSTQWMKCLIIG